MWVLDCNDSGLRLANGDQVALESPGFVVVDGATLHVGEPARRQARRHPHLSHARYWYQLDQLPLERPLGNARSAADLAWMHLSDLQTATAGEPIILAVPSSFDSGQLGLLLGLCKAAKLEVIGLVDSAVAAVVELPLTGDLLHLDVQLHRFYLTPLEVGEQIVRGVGVDAVKPGLAALWDAAATTIAAAFVRQTRFDPLRSADTEQLLYDELPTWLAGFTRQSTQSLALTVGERAHRLSLDRETVVDALQPTYRRIASAVNAEAATRRSVQVVLSDRCAALPGLAEALSLDRTPVVLTPLAVARGALRQVALIRSDQTALPRVTRLPAAAPRALQAHAAPPPPAPTHLLIDDHAFPLTAAEAQRHGLSLRFERDTVWLNPADALTVNGKPLAQPLRLTIGDQLKTPSVVGRLIHVAAAM